MKTNILGGKQIVVVTGPESSGKTTLVNRLKADYGMPIVAEFARTYLQQNGAEYSFEDLEIIGKCQNIQELEAHNTYPIIVCDTDIVTIDIWAMEVFGKPIFLPNRNTDVKYYLLCNPDIPWEPGAFRENPNDRERLFRLYYKYLEGRGLSFEVLKEEGRMSWKPE